MNALVEQKATVSAGGSIAALIPQNIEEAFRVAKYFAASGLAPRGMDTPEKIIVAIMAGAELGLPPFQALQSFAVVNGRPTLWGDGLIAVVRSNGFQVREWIEGAGNDAVAHCEVTRPDSGEMISRSFSVADAKTAGLWDKQGPWKTNPARMLQMRARGFACRDGAADVIRGFQMREEVEDYQPIKDVTPKATGIAARLASQTAAPSEGFTVHHAEPQKPQEIDAILEGDDIPNLAPEPVQEPVKADSAKHAPTPLPTLAERVKAFQDRLDAAPSTTKMKAIWAASAALRSDLDAKDPDTLTDLESDFETAFAAMDDKEKAGAA